MKVFVCIISILLYQHFVMAQNVGIGTTSPIARLHVSDSNVVFTGPLAVPNTTNFAPPVSGAGSRMMWYPQKAAFRVGAVDGAQWDKDNIGLFSFASGYNTKALGFSSTAIGYQTAANGPASASMGYQTAANGVAATSMGYQTNAIGQYSTTLGNQTQANGNSSISMGYFTNANADYTTSMGIGTNATAAYATSMGYFTKADGVISTAMGQSTISKSANSLVAGIYNDTTNTNRLFEIGNGTANNARSNAMTVLTNGNVGIGISSPLASLHVADSNVVFSGANSLPAAQGNPPVSGAGIRMMWYPDKAAFRAGYAFNTAWDKSNIGNYSFATGSGSIASGVASFANGVGIATGSYATALNNSTANGSSSLAACASTTNGDYSFAAGIGTISKGASSMVIGSYNDQSDNPSTFFFGVLSSDRLFQIGNGTDNGSRNNAMTVLRNGNIGIGTTTPNAALQFANNTASRKIVLYDGANNDNQFSGFGLENAFIRYQLANTAGNHIFFAGTSPTSSNELFRISGNGNATLAGVLTQNSDARLKTNIRPIHSALEQLQNIKGYTYNWLDKNRDTALQVGVLAQEVQQIYPQLVHQNEKGELSVNYMGLVPVLIEAIKELHKEIEELKAKNK